MLARSIRRLSTKPSFRKREALNLISSPSYLNVNCARRISNISTMALSSKIHLNGHPSSFAARGETTKESTEKANTLLQQNHDTLHIFFDLEDRLHNHIAHHLLASYALGATPENLQFAYDSNRTGQTPIGEKKTPVIQNLSNNDDWSKYLAEADSYHSFMQFFQDSMDKVGWQETIKKYLFSEQAANNRMPERLVSGFLHPWIHLGYGIEFEQPAIIAEALAQTAVHDAWTSDYLKACASQAAELGATRKKATMTELVQEAKASEKLKSSTRVSDPQKNKAVFSRALNEMVELASKWYIPPSASDADVKAAAAELASSAAYICFSTPRLDKKVKFDFFLMHTVTSSVFLDVWARQEWLGNAEKAVLLNYFGWMTINMYVSRGCADINLSQVDDYIGKLSSAGEAQTWESLSIRANKLKDDGHLPKTVRALMNGEGITKAYWGTPGFEVTGEQWLKMAEMTVDSLEDHKGDEPKWVRSVGHDGMWSKVGPRVVYGQ